MHHRLRRAAALLLVVASVAAPVVLAPSANAKVSLPLKGLIETKADDNSLNWAGYYVPAVAGKPITQVSTTLITPKPKLLPPLLSASWVGIGGAATNDLIQAGVAFQSTPEEYYAWYEVLPAAITPIRSGCIGDATCKVVPNDKVTVDIRSTGGTNWKITMVNVGKWTWSLNLSYPSTFSSAEWIYEAPARAVLGVPVYGLPAANDHIMFFDNAYTAGGTSKLLATADAVKSNLSPVGVVNLATPSPIRPSSAFSVCPYKQACPAP